MGKTWLVQALDGTRDNRVFHAATAEMAASMFVNSYQNLPPCAVNVYCVSERCETFYAPQKSV